MASADGSRLGSGLIGIEDWDGTTPRLLVCRNIRFRHDRPSCGTRGAPELIEALQKRLEAEGLADQVELLPSPCLGYCSRGPNVRLAGHELWQGVAATDIDRILIAVRAVVEKASAPMQSGESAAEPA